MPKPLASETERLTTSDLMATREPSIFAVARPVKMACIKMADRGKSCAPDMADAKDPVLDVDADTIPSAKRLRFDKDRPDAKLTSGATSGHCDASRESHDRCVPINDAQWLGPVRPSSPPRREALYENANTLDDRNDVGKESLEKAEAVTRDINTALAGLCAKDANTLRDMAEETLRSPFFPVLVSFQV